LDLGLRGRPALVAAASRGIGFASALSLAREGARVAICSRDAEAIEDAAGRIRTDTGGDVVALPADVSSAAGAQGFVRGAIESLGGCHILVANAGGPPFGRAEGASDEELGAAFELNFLSTVRMIREAVPAMRAAGYGRVVQIASGSVKEPIPGLALSNVARAATNGFLQTLARELAPDGITVNSVLPGRVLTDRARDLAGARAGGGDPEPVLAAQAANVPIGRLGEPAEVGDLVAFLASERASYLTGCLIDVDGGLRRGIL
jgi:3-oxoacyl-[acyl-carrier protein] reductase